MIRIAFKSVTVTNVMHKIKIISILTLHSLVNLLFVTLATIKKIHILDMTYPQISKLEVHYI